MHESLLCARDAQNVVLMSSHLVLTASMGRSHWYPCLTNVGTEAQRGRVTHIRSHSQQWYSWEQSPRLCISLPVQTHKPLPTLCPMAPGKVPTLGSWLGSGRDFLRRDVTYASPASLEVTEGIQKSQCLPSQAGARPAKGQRAVTPESSPNGGHLLPTA